MSGNQCNNSEKSELAAQYIKNFQIQKTLYKFGRFMVDSNLKTWRTLTFDEDIIKKTIIKYGLFGDEIYFDKYQIYEWGYTFLIVPIDGWNSLRGTAGFERTPNTRKEALDMLKEWIFEFYEITEGDQWEAGNGHMLWQHYSAEFGASSIGTELGNSISSSQSHIAFSRGASRQYHLPWFGDFSFWHQGYINDYSGRKRYKRCSTPTGGHSASLYLRSFISCYYGGCSHFYPEALLEISFTGEIDEDGCYKLSPIGEATGEINSFVEKNPDIGVSYIPFGIVIDQNHGMFSGDTRITQKKSFQVFEYNNGDEMTYRLLEMFFPQSWIVTGSNETHYQVNGPYGDTCDVLLQNAPLDVLESYPCIILSGDIHFTGEEVHNYKLYAENGGTLLINTAYLPYFPEYMPLYNPNSESQIIETGNGKVIIYGNDFDTDGLDGIIRDLLKQLVPFRFSKDIEYLINIKENSIIVTLINNNDYLFNHISGESTDFTKTLDFSVSYTGDKKIKQIRELWNGSNDVIKDNSINISMIPGEIRVYEYFF